VDDFDCDILFDTIASMNWFYILIVLVVFVILEELPCPLLCFFLCGIGAGMFVRPLPTIIDFDGEVALCDRIRHGGCVL
jgi:hypothetical protein